VGLAILPFLASCVNIVHRHTTNELQLGKRREEVMAIMGGEPDEKKIYGSREVLVYYIHSSIFDLFTNGEKFPFVGFYPLFSTGREFWIILNNNRIEAFGYAKDFGNSLKNIGSGT
jgi:hypothetical protein